MSEIKIFNKDFFITTTLAIVVILLLLERQCIVGKLSSELKESTDLYNAIQDTVQTYKDKNGRQIAAISLLQTSQATDFIALKTKDSTIIELQETVKLYKKNLKPGSSVTLIENRTNVSTNLGTKITSRDTIRVDSFIYIYPAYAFDTNLKNWIFVCGLATRDSTHLDLTVRNKYKVVVGYEKGKLFKPKEPFAEVTNENPYTETTILRAYQVSVPKPKRLGVGVSVGYGFYFDPQKVRIGHGFITSISLNYNLINIK